MFLTMSGDGSKRQKKKKKGKVLFIFGLFCGFTAASRHSGVLVSLPDSVCVPVEPVY